MSPEPCGLRNGVKSLGLAALLVVLAVQLARAAPPAQANVAGDPDRGRALFMGDSHFRNDGPPCMGCHNVGRAGALGGGVLGPDLTQAFDKYGDVALATVLADIPWPTMRPIFVAHPLTPEEQADLHAFLRTASSEQPANKELLVLGLSLAGFLGAMVAAGLVWRRRLRGIRGPLVQRARTKP